MGNQRNTIDINCDLGEGMPNDAEIMQYIDSCNVACGGHAGDSESMMVTVALAKQYGVKVGAHPSFPDKENFGRKIINMELSELKGAVYGQIMSFQAVCDSMQVEMHHIKLHGALYNLAAKDASYTAAMTSVFQNFPETKIYAPFRSELARRPELEGKIIHEAFIDRSYAHNGMLVPRSQDNSVITSKESAWAQLQEIHTTKYVTSIEGSSIPMEADTYCIHGDNESVLSILAFIQSQRNE